jgi:methionyl-tRNA formyltransferase
MKIVFAGSPEYALPALKALISAGEEVTAVITQPDKPVGRKKILTPTPVKAYALSCNLPVLDFAKIREHEEEVKSLGADLMITCAYGQILTKGILNAFPQGVWNLHASLLPKYRGASPIQSAILGGEKYTGVTVMRTEEALDCGDILLVKRCEIGSLTYGELSDKLSLLSAEAAVEAVKLIKNGKTQTILQDEVQATYCKKIQKSEAKINFGGKDADIVRAIKAYSPSPAAFCNLNGSPVNIYNAEVASGNLASIDNSPAHMGQVIAADKQNGIVVKCGEGAIKILSLQLSGGKVLSAADIINGRKIKAGDLLD